MASELSNAIVEAAERMQKNDEGDIDVAGVIYIPRGPSGLYLQDYRSGYMADLGTDILHIIYKAKQRGLVPIKGPVAAELIRWGNDVHQKMNCQTEILVVLKAA
eukprot:scaffold22736_cov111-Cylindrotheca_fusiformis.AAC.10